MTRDKQELKAVARALGGGWRIENDVMPVVVLTLPEAIAALDRTLTPTEARRLAEYADEWEPDSELVAKLRHIAEVAE